MNRVSINYLNRFKGNIADASAHLRRLIRLHSDDEKVVSISLEGSLIGIAIAYLRFTGDAADQLIFAEIVVDIALGLGKPP
jgi:hypothetical protein